MISDQSCDSSSSNNNNNNQNAKNATLSTDSSDSSNGSCESEPTMLKISEGEVRLIGIISTFLHVHPFGASVDYIWSYVQKVVPTMRPRELEVILAKFPSLFKQQWSGVGATLERKWVFVGFS